MRGDDGLNDVWLKDVWLKDVWLGRCRHPAEESGVRKRWRGGRKWTDESVSTSGYGGL